MNITSIRRPAPRGLTPLNALGVAVILAAAFAALLAFRSAAGAQTPNDPFYPEQWGLPAVRAPQAWDITTGSSSIRVAVIDTGVSSIPELQGKVAPGYNAIVPGGSADDDYGSYGSGVRVGSVITANTNNGSGMAGVAWNVMLVPVKVCNATGTCLAADLAEGINWAANNNVQIIHIGVSLSASTPEIDAAVANALSRGILVVAGSGNVVALPVAYPASYPGVITVGATDSANAASSFSARGPQVELAAPGTGVTTAARGGCCLVGSGTNLAAGHVTGALALLLSAGVPASQAPTHLYQSAVDLGVAGQDTTFGYGLLDICGAFARAGLGCGAGPTATPTRTNTPVPATATPTRTSTPVPATATPTRTNTPVGPTSTPTRTSTPVPATATPTRTSTSVPATSTPTRTNTPAPTNTPCKGKGRKPGC